MRVSRALYVDCFSGAAGDMLLGALLHAGAPLDELRAGLKSLPIDGWSLTAEMVTRGGIVGCQAHVRLDAAAPQPARGLRQVLDVVRASALPREVQDRASAVFGTLAEAEASVHGTSPDDVHFHEVGAVDAILDVVGTVYAVHLLGAPDLFSSGLPLGAGWARGEHGRLPVPAPATLELLRLSGAPTRSLPTDEPLGEVTTPTGAALLTTLARFEQPPLTTVERVGYGFGTRELPWPNAVRVWLGSLANPGALRRDSVVQIETNLDDATPEQLGFAMERLLEAGALDVAFSPLQMKKNRPGVLVRVLAHPHDGERLTHLLLTHTSALGARVQTVDRLVADRGERTVQTPWGPVRVKEKRLGEMVIPSPEYEDCAELARRAGVPLADVYDAARWAASESTPR